MNNDADQPKRNPEGEQDADASAQASGDASARADEQTRDASVNNEAEDASATQAEASADDSRSSDPVQEEDAEAGGPVDADAEHAEPERSIALMLKAKLAEIRDPDTVDTGEELDEELAATLLALVLGELSNRERDELLERAKREPRIARELQRLSAHLKLHQSVSRVAPNRGSFARLSSKMKERELLGEVIPGRHSLWRRAMMVAATVFVGFIIINAIIAPADPGKNSDDAARAKLTIITPNRTDSRLVTFGEHVELRDGAGDVLLTSGGRGLLTKIRMAPNSRFVLVSADELRIESGGAERIEVDPNARTFSVVTPHARFELPQGGKFSVSLGRSRSHVCVVDGRVQVKTLDGDSKPENMRTVYPGYSFSIGEEGTVFGIEPDFFLRIQLEPIPGKRERLRVRFINQSGMELKILRPQGDPIRDKMLRADVTIAEGDLPPGTPLFSVEVDQDQRGANDPIQGRSGAPITLIPMANVNDGPRSAEDQQWLTLAADGPGSQVEFEASLLQPLQSLKEADYTLSLSYAGPVRTEHFGEMNQLIPSTNVRIDLKPKDGSLPGSGENAEGEDGDE